MRHSLNTLHTILSAIGMTLLLASGGFAQDRQPIVPSTNTIDLRSALEEKRVAATFTGLGASSGDAILLEVKRLQEAPLLLSIRPGTTLLSTNPSVQNMVIRRVKGIMLSSRSYEPTDIIDLNTSVVATYLLDAYCLDFGKDNPSEDNTFELAEVDKGMRSIFQCAEARNISTRVLQAAIWISRDNVSAHDLEEKFNVTDEDYMQARELLQECIR